MNIFRPYKSDVRQIESLVKLGANTADISMVLGITPVQLKKWEEKNVLIAELLKPKPRPECNLNSPEFAANVEEAFTCGGKRFYRFHAEYEMPAGRYKYFYFYLREAAMHASLETLRKYVEAFKAVLNGVVKKGGAQGDLWKLVWNLETIVKLDFDPELVKRLASVAYFDETEDLITYDKAYGEEKIKLWDDHKLHDFFLMSPIGELFGLSNLSIEYLEECLTEREAILKELDSNLLTVLKENS